MPTVFSHAFVGAAIGSTGSRPRPKWLLLAFAIVASAPDLDVVGYWMGIPYAHPLGHRGLSHSLPFAVALSAASIPLWRKIVPDQVRLMTTLTFLAVGSHGVLDTFTNAGHGIGLLIPFDNTRYFAPWRPIMTSPLSLSAFFSGFGVRVLANEAILIGVPTALFLAVRSIDRARRKTRSAA